MERRLFDDLVVSRVGARGARSRGGMPVSFAIHVAGVAGLLALTVIVPEELPAPPQPPIADVVIAAPRPPAPGPPRPVGPRRARPEPARALVVPDDDTPSVAPEPDPFDVATPGEPCPSCAPVDGPVGGGDGPPVGPGDGGGGGPAAVPERLRVGGSVEAPRKIVHVDPVYPALAQRAGVTGIVILECVIARDGSVTGVRVLRGHPLLDSAAADAVRRWTYRPTLLNGVPVEVVMTVTVRFETRR